MHSNLARTLVLYQGGDYVFDVTVVDDAGAPIDLTDVVLAFQVRSTMHGEVEFGATSGDGITHTDEPAGEAILTVTADMEPAVYRYGLWLTDVLGNRQPLQERGHLHVRLPVVREAAS